MKWLPTDVCGLGQDFSASRKPKPCSSKLCPRKKRRIKSSTNSQKRSTGRRMTDQVPSGHVVQALDGTRYSGQCAIHETARHYLRLGWHVGRQRLPTRYGLAGGAAKTRYRSSAVENSSCHRNERSFVLAE